MCVGPQQSAAPAETQPNRVGGTALRYSMQWWEEPSSGVLQPWVQNLTVSHIRFPIGGISYFGLSEIQFSSANGDI